MNKKPIILVVLGPTATGKSDLAVKLAKKFNGEVISADSRQVYQGLDLGTGKITKAEMGGVPHYLLDVVSPKKQFTVADFQSMAHSAINDIIARGKLPIICGGTGFYIQSIVDNINYPDVKPNVRLRARLSKLSTKALFTELKKLDPRRAKEIDPHNKVKIIRAIEIARVLCKVPKLQNILLYTPIQIGVDLPDAELKEKIRSRLMARLKQGMVHEIENLHRKGLSWKRMHALGLEYRYLSLFLRKKISRQEMISTLEKEIWHYVKRQRTWFRRDKRIQWFSPGDRRIEDAITDFFSKIQGHKKYNHPCEVF
jgi:tRNA dimethylallyltransferase